MMRRTFLILIFFSFFIIDETWAQSEMVDNGGHLVHVEIDGVEDRVPGEPVIIFENPSLGTTQSWDSIFHEASEIAPVLRYDRSGLGESEWDNKEPSPTNIALNLRNLLEVMEVDPPYVLVGHSWGAQLVRRFAHMFPNQTVGLVIVDPGFRPSTMKAALTDIGYPAERGLQEYVQQLQNGELNSYPSEVQKAHLAAMGDWFASPDLPPTPRIPVAALLAGKHDPPPPGVVPETSYDFMEWARALYPHERKRLVEWTLDSPNGLFILADRSGHFIQNDEPKLVLTAIDFVVSKIKKSSN